MNKIWDNLHSIIEMSCEMIWSDIKKYSKQANRIYQLGSEEDVKVDKLTNGINCPISDEEREERERQIYLMEHYDFSEYSSSKTSHNEINHLRDENGLPFELRKVIKSK